MLIVGDLVKVTGKTIVNAKEVPAIPIGTICEVTDIETYTATTIYEITPLEGIKTPYWYDAKDLEKGHFIWVKD